MAIDRGPWNALVDDDGSGEVGSIWNKAAIKTVLLDPTDAELAGTWTPVPHAASNYTASAGTWTVTAANQVAYTYRVHGKTVFMGISIDSSALSAAAVRLFLSLPSGLPTSTVQLNAPVTYYGTAGNVVGTGFAEISASTTIGFLRDIAGTQWPAGTIFLRGEWFYPIA